VTLHTKADRTSPAAAQIEPGLLIVDVDFSTVGLSGDGVYWHVSHMVGGVELGELHIPHWYTGYVHEDDVETDGTDDLAAEEN
jgi:hypothetical protein